MSNSEPGVYSPARGCANGSCTSNIASWKPTGICLVCGSIIGIAVWGTLYILGAAIFSLLHLDIVALGSASQAAVGVYGCLAACSALWVGAFVASHTSNAKDRSAGALCGVLMWGMSTITMIGVVFALSLGALAKLSGAGLRMVQIGASAVGGVEALTVPGPSSVAEETFLQVGFEPTQILLAMFGLIVISLVIATRGGIAGAAQKLE